MWCVSSSNIAKTEKLSATESPTQKRKPGVCFFFTWRERLDSGKDKDTVVFVLAEMAVVAEAAAEMEAARIPDFFMSLSYFAKIQFATLSLRYFVGIWQITDGLYMQREK